MSFESPEVWQLPCRAIESNKVFEALNRYEQKQRQASKMFLSSFNCLAFAALNFMLKTILLWLKFGLRIDKST
jgi:hypothetical protein